MRTWISLAVLLLAGCTTNPSMDDASNGADGIDEVDGVDEGDAPCPGHFHVTLLVADGDEVLPYYDEEPGNDDRDPSQPVEGIHMHRDDGIIHIHPPVETCYALGWALAAVDVHALQRDGGAVQVDDDVRNGTVRLDVQPWGEAWQTWDLERLQDTVPNAARALLMVNPPADVTALRGQVPEIPASYQPR